MPVYRWKIITPTRLALVSGPGASRVCSTFFWYITVVPLAPGVHEGPAAISAA